MPFEAGELKRRRPAGRPGGRHRRPCAPRGGAARRTPTPDRDSVAADGRSLVFVTAEVVDRRGVVVPGAEHLISFDVAGGSLAGLDNGRQESAGALPGQYPHRLPRQGPSPSCGPAPGRARYG
ncbi:hypothetical protein LV779_21330 [Streptomyces thinghirensis]|nr:hypothetical protein [Streptomyces thinghirensis]